MVEGKEDRLAVRLLLLYNGLKDFTHYHRTCHFEGKKYLQYEITDKFTEEDGSTRLYVNRESVFPEPSAWPIPHDAPYKAHLNLWIMASLEVGRVVGNIVSECFCYIHPFF